MNFKACVAVCLWICLAAGALATDVGPGDVSGTWTAAGSPYIVLGNISVEPKASLTIEPGVEVLFDGPYTLDVNGSISVVGTESDSIIFSRNDGQTEWGHISISPGLVGSILKYCRIEYGNAPVFDMREDLSMGGGIYVDAAVGVTILNCSIEHCRANLGGGIYAKGPVTISDCAIRHCTADGEEGRGGGAFLFASVDLLFSELAFNTATHMGGGVFGSIYGGEILDCSIHDNTVASGSGGGLAFDGLNLGEVVGCLIYSNQVIDDSSGFCSGGGVGLWDSNGSFVNNTVVGNSAMDGAGFSYGWSTLDIVSTIIAFNEGSATSSVTDSSVDFFATCSFGNTESDLLEGLETATINEHPLFCDYGLANFTLCADSPCLPKNIGAEGQGCGNCWPAVESTSWSRVKTLY